MTILELGGIYMIQVGEYNALYCVTRDKTTGVTLTSVTRDGNIITIAHVQGQMKQNPSGE